MPVLWGMAGSFGAVALATMKPEFFPVLGLSQTLGVKAAERTFLIIYPDCQYIPGHRTPPQALSALDP